MAQFIIDYGSSANDGQGDPLRTAFIKTDENFDQIWAAGPVGSNITILNNTVSVSNTNGNLVLQPNGVGVIQANAAVVPSLNGAYDLGTTDRRWKTIFANTIAANNISYQGNVFTGNLEGNVLYSDGITLLVNNVTGEIVANSMSAPVTVTNIIRSDDSAFVEIRDGINVDGSAIVVNDVAVGGNVSAQYFIGNGSQLTGIAASYGNADVAAYLAAGLAGNIIPSANVTYSLGNATNQWANVWVAANTIYIGGVALGVTGNVLTVAGEPVLSNDSSSSITTTGNITADYFIGNGSQLTGLPASYSNSNVATFLADFGSNNISTTGNIAVGDVTGTTGSNTLVLRAEPGSNTSLQLNNTVDSYIRTVANLEIRTDVNDVPYVWRFSDTGALTFPDGNTQTTAYPGFDQDLNTTDTVEFLGVTASTLAVDNITVDPSGLVNLQGANLAAVNALGAVTVTAENFLGNIAAANVVGTVSSATTAATVTTAAQPNITSVGTLSSITVTGNVNAGNVVTENIINTNDISILSDGNVEIVADNDGGAWGFFVGADGEILVNAANLATLGGGNLYSDGAVTAIGNITGGNVITDTVSNSGNISVSAGNVIVKTDDARYEWVFDWDGGLTLPSGTIGAGEGGVIWSPPNRSIWISGTSANSSTDGSGVVLNGGLNQGTGRGGGISLFGGLSAGGRGGSIFIDAGLGNGSANNGTITIGSVNTSSTVIGAVAQSNNIFYGTVVGNLSGFDTANASAPQSITIRAGDNTGGDLFNAANGGTLTLRGGDSGFNPGGALQLRGGNGSVDGDVIIGDITTTSVKIGNTAITANVVGNLTVGVNATVAGNITAGNINANVAGYSIGYREIPQIALSANANVALADSGKHFYSTTAGNLSLLIPTNANVAFPTGTAFTVVVQAAGNVLVNADSGVNLYLAGNSTAGNRVVSTYGMATVMKVATDTWFINGTGVA